LRSPITSTVLLAMVFAAMVTGFSRVIESPALRNAVQGNGEGVLDTLSVKSVGGPLAAATLGAGTLFACLLSLKQRELRPLMGAIFAPAAAAAVFLLLRRGGFPIVTYRIVKNGQTAFPFLCVAGGFGLAYLAAQTTWNPIRLRWFGSRPWAAGNALAIGTALACLAFVARPAPLGLTSLDLVDRDAYELSRVAAKILPPEEVGIVADGLGGYTLWWAGVGRTVPFAGAQMIPRITLFDAWPEGPRTEKYLLVDSTVRALYESRPGVRVYKSRNGAAILERIDK
jgi:hypothetical protein